VWVEGGKGCGGCELVERLESEKCASETLEGRKVQHSHQHHAELAMGAENGISSDSWQEGEGIWSDWSAKVADFSSIRVKWVRSKRRGQVRLISLHLTSPYRPYTPHCGVAAYSGYSFTPTRVMPGRSTSNGNVRRRSSDLRAVIWSLQRCP
jgi:hypothetical protein